ncbi:PIN domain-containing protein [Flavobacterium sp. ZB4P13]|uniref:PIN domain-containing protein n=1 Tax=Flavobacterium sp. ZB4P13 TaxID=3401728 RepID=UPI003AADB3B1
MTKILIDTCVWLDIAKTDKGEKILNLLEEFIKQEEITILLPDIVISEFNRNKDRITSEAKKSVSNHFKKVREMVFTHGNKETRNNILTELNNIDHKIPVLGDMASYSIERIEELFYQSEIINITDEIKLRATQRAIDKKAPFHLSKNSIGDALIIESYLDYKMKNETQEFGLMFITHNKNDFSLKNGNQKEPHEDFSQIFDSNKSQYFINLTEALKSVNSELINEIEFENDWELEPRGITEIWKAEKEFEEKIWYNRHQNLAYKISIEEIKIIEQEEFSTENTNSTIILQIWEGAEKSAKKLEEKYGKENLIWDDFEWGMINGKLSALRWTTGEEWDNLDT